MAKKLEKGWLEDWKMVNVDGEVGLYFVCHCSNDTLITPSSMAEVGTPICPDCDVEMTYEATYIKKYKKNQNKS